MNIAKKVTLDLIGVNGNAFAILGAFTKQARREGWTQPEIDVVVEGAISGDYDHLLQTIILYCKEA